SQDAAQKVRCSRKLVHLCALRSCHSLAGKSAQCERVFVLQGWVCCWLVVLPSRNPPSPMFLCRLTFPRAERICPERGLMARCCCRTNGRYGQPARKSTCAISP